MQRRLLINWGQTLLLNAALPIATYVLLAGNGVNPLLALFISGAWPVLEIAVSVVAQRRLDELSVIVLAFLALSIAATAGTDNPKLLLLKDAVTTGVTGIVFLGSLVMPRPLAFYFGRRFATGGTVEGARWWDGLWRYPSFRRSQRVITVVWGAAFMADAILRVWLVTALPLAAGAVVSPLILVAAIGVSMSVTITIGRRTRRAAGAAAAGPPVTAPAE